MLLNGKKKSVHCALSCELLVNKTYQNRGGALGFKGQMNGATIRIYTLIITTRLIASSLEFLVKVSDKTSCCFCSNLQFHVYF